MTSPGNDSESVACPHRGGGRARYDADQTVAAFTAPSRADIRISTRRTTQKVRDIERDPRVAFCVDDQVAGEYLTLYGEAVIVADERVAELTWPLLLAYMHPAEATARWERINADGSRVVIVLRPASVTGRQQVR